MQPEMAKQSIQIAYDGPALQEGRMDVRDFAPALLAFGDLCEESFRLLHGKERRLRVEVQAGFKKGSFGVHLDLTGIWTQFVQMFSANEASAVANLLEILGFTTFIGAVAKTGLVQLVRWAKGKRPERVFRIGDGTVRIDLGDESLIVSEEVARLYADVRVRNHLAAVVAPLTKEGIDTFETRDANNAPITRIERSEVMAFAPPAVLETEETPPLVDREEDRAFGVVSPTFKNDNKWRLSDGDASVYATMEDKDFLRKVDAREVSFTKGDVLFCRVRVLQFHTSNGVRTEYTILRVLEHKPAPRQLVMRIPDAGPPEK